MGDSCAVAAQTPVTFAEQQQLLPQEY